MRKLPKVPKGKVRKWYVTNKHDPNDTEGPFDSEDVATELANEWNAWEVGYMDDDDDSE